MPPVRHDLLALTPTALASLSNLGLLKRAQRECEEGGGPRLETGEDGTVTARFADGVEVRLVSGRALKDCPCTCGAVGVCRHRLAAILAYQRATPAGPGPAAQPPWSPAEIDDAALERLLGRAALARAAALRRRGVLVEVTRGDFEGDRLPRAQLATATVRFLVARDPSHARCDCRARTGCEHVALAVWAFRLAAQRDPAAAVLTVEVVDAAAGQEGRREAGLQAVREAAALVLLEGASRLPPAAGSRFALARLSLEQARMAWPADALDELVDLVEAYRRRSSRYSPERLLGTLVDLLARARAGEGRGALPACAALGSEEAPEAELDQLRLCALGARVEPDGDQRRVDVLFADPASQVMLVVRKSYATSDGEADGPHLARRPGLPGASLGQLATCQLVSNAAVRRPNRQVTFRSGPLRKTSVLPGGGLEAVPEPLRVREVPGFLRQLAAQPPRMLRPRLLAENVRVFSLLRVEEMAYDAGEQTLHATCFAEDERTPFLLEARYRAVAPGAVLALARLLGSGEVRAVVGDARRHGAGLVVDPIAVWTHRLEVLDLQEGSLEAARALTDLAHHQPRGDEDPMLGVLGRARALLAEAAHQGLRNLGHSWHTRLAETRARLAAQGLPRFHAALTRLHDALSGAQATGVAEDEAHLVEHWASAAILAELAMATAEETS